jgi:hypothetical protein
MGRGEPSRYCVVPNRTSHDLAVAGTHYPNDTDKLSLDINGAKVHIFVISFLVNCRAGG